MLRILLSLLIAVLVNPIKAASLDSEVNRLLSNDCFELGVPGGGGFPGESLGPNLYGICFDGFSSPTGTSTSGNADTLGSQNLPKKNNESSFLYEDARSSIWTNIEYQEIKQKSSEFEAEYSYDSKSIVLGYDYGLSSSQYLGLAIQYGNGEADYKNRGGFDDENTEIYFYYIFTSAQFFVDFGGSYLERKISNERFAVFLERGGSNSLETSGFASSDQENNSTMFFTTVGTAFNFDSYELTPSLSLLYQETKKDGYQERGSSGLELIISDTEIESLRTDAGLYVSRTVNQDWGVATPFFSANWIHEFKIDRPELTARFVEDIRDNPLSFNFSLNKPDSDYFRFMLGSVFNLTQGKQIYVSASSSSGLDRKHEVDVSAGLRWEL